MEQVAFSVGNEGRQVFWNAEHFEPILFLLTAVAIVIFAYGIYRRWQMWTVLGKPETRLDQLGARVKALLMNGLVQWKTFSDPYPGIMHGLIFFGFSSLSSGRRSTPPSSTSRSLSAGPFCGGPPTSFFPS
jgi:hypothetical protein